MIHIYIIIIYIKLCINGMKMSGLILPKTGNKN